MKKKTYHEKVLDSLTIKFLGFIILNLTGAYMISSLAEIIEKKGHTEKNDSTLLRFIIDNKDFLIESQVFIVSCLYICVCILCFKLVQIHYSDR